ncbi:MAG: GNAT family N-acetyltransferase [Flavobacteriales bacterium]|nr:GNAT family N-acetyltransferase [Flavobacteriales bacterium]
MSLTFVKIGINDDSQLMTIERLANEIWIDHYSPIIGKDQVDYMLDKFQSLGVMKEQILNAYAYYLIQCKQESIGYFAIQQRESKIFISKVYIKKSHRGNGYFSEILKFIEEKALKKNCNYLELTVNVNNHLSIDTYLSKGFYISHPEVFDIGNGYIMDDFVMLKELTIN